MAQVIADRRDVDFVLHEQLNVGELSKHEKFEEFNKKTVDLIISEARNLAIKEILPTLKEGDEQGCRLGKRGGVCSRKASSAPMICSLKANGWPCPRTRNMAGRGCLAPWLWRPATISMGRTMPS